MDRIPLVGHAGVGFAEKVAYAKTPGLVLEIRLMDGAEEKDREIPGVAVFQDFAGAGEEGDGMVQFAEYLAKDFLQFVKRCVGNVFLIETFVGEIEFLPESLAIEWWLAVGGKDAIGGLEDRGEVIDEGAGPVEDNVSNQELE